MAVGWTRDGAVQDQIDATLEDAVQLARSRLPEGDSCSNCEECDALIPDERRKAVPGVRLCIKCQAELEKQHSPTNYFNRSGSKDSQLK